MIIQEWEERDENTRTSLAIFGHNARLQMRTHADSANIGDKGRRLINEINNPTSWN